MNESVADGTTLHWHGVDIPNAEDGVAGVTQDAVPPGGEHIYRFRVEEPGTYWYHSHQVSHEQVTRGLFGALVIKPRNGEPEGDVVAAVHTYDGLRSVSGRTGVQRIDAYAGDDVTVRVVNTDSASLRVSVTGAPYRVTALDARDINEPTDVTDEAVRLSAGGRADLAVTVPADGSPVRADVGAGAALAIGPAGAAEPPAAEIEPTLSYGTLAPIGFAPNRADRHFEMRIGRRPGFLDGRPGLWWTDSLDVRSGETYEIAFRADNPGIWVNHCHNLPHAAEGMITHLMYEGVTTPYRVGGQADNEPE